MTKLRPIGRLNAVTALVLSLLMLLAGRFAAWHYYSAPPVQRYAPLLAQLAVHAVKPDPLGRLDLSRSYPGLTQRDQAFVQYRDDGTFLAMFPNYYGEGTQIAGLLYTSRPLQDGDTQPRDDVHMSERLIGVATYENLIIDKQINPNWYYVSYHLH